MKLSALFLAVTFFSLSHAETRVPCAQVSQLATSNCQSNCATTGPGGPDGFPVYGIIASSTCTYVYTGHPAGTYDIECVCSYLYPIGYEGWIWPTPPPWPAGNPVPPPAPGGTLQRIHRTQILPPEEPPAP